MDVSEVMLGDLNLFNITKPLMIPAKVFAFNVFEMKMIVIHKQPAGDVICFQRDW